MIVCAILGGAVAALLQGRSDGADDWEDAGEVAPDAAGGGFEESLRDAIAADPGDVAALASLANLLANRGELSEAIDRYEDALGLDPASATIRFDFATSLAEAGRRSDAELQFRRLLEADPANVEAQFYLADLYRAWQPPRTDEAVALYRRVIASAPDSYLGDRSTDELRRLGAAPSTPPAIPAGSPTANAMKEERT